MNKNGGDTFFWLSLMGIVVFATLDRFLKIFAELFSGRFGWRFFSFEQFHNNGVAFSLPIPFWIVLPLTLIFLIGLVLWGWKSEDSLSQIAIAAITLGALSNAFDRIFFEYTIDYLRIFNMVINIADLLVLFGIALLFHSHKKT